MYPKYFLLDILYEDQNILIVNKKINQIVISENNYSNSIVNNLLYYYYYIRDLYRFGVVHRLDKNTTGILIFSKDTYTQFKLLKLFKKHLILRNYFTITYSKNVFNSVLKTLIKKKEKKFLSNNSFGKESITQFYLIKKINNFNFFILSLKTGRTHQIRSHCEFLNSPVVGDYLYSYKKPYFNSILLNNLLNCIRPMLHSVSLVLKHPFNMSFLKIFIDISSDILLIKNQVEINKYLGFF